MKWLWFIVLGATVAFADPLSSRVAETTVAVALPTNEPVVHGMNGKYGMYATNTGNYEFITINFKNGDIVNVIRMIARSARLNVVVDPDVEGKVTMELRNVHWTDALNSVLRSQRCEMATENGVIRISQCSSEDQESHTIKKARCIPVSELKDKRYAVTMSAKNQDIATTIGTIARLSGEKIVVTQGISGRTTYELSDVNWELALALVLDGNGLTYEREIEVTRVMDNGRTRKQLEDGVNALIALLGCLVGVACMVYCAIKWKASG